MRKWYEPSKETREAERKPAAVLSIDLRSLLMGTAVLVGMALLLIIGLTPRTASAPDADLPDTALVGSDTAVTLSAECQLIQHLTYTPCGHELTRRQTLPTELAGKGRAELEAAYDLWQVTSFAAGEVTMAQALDMYCPEHVILMPDESGMLCVFENRYGDALGLVRELNVPLSELPDDVQETLRSGKGFDSEEELDLWLESIES
ncbi:MAG: hypothetical protein J1E43_01365 [Christensenellaceae bacterium]|nr:hypothetical protein [Christensenellaceae bacterium]